MGTYIPGMEMPTSCAECRFYGEYCYVKGDENRHSNLPCPLIPVPEHGDLIDTRPFDVLSFHNPEPGYENTFMDGVLWMSDKIDDAPVVIPADPEEEEKT